MSENKVDMRLVDKRKKMLMTGEVMGAPCNKKAAQQEKLVEVVVTILDCQIFT